MLTCKVEQALSLWEQRADAILAERSAQYLHKALSTGIWIYGAGNYGRTIAILAAQRGYPVCGFIDRNGHAIETVDGYQVVTPSAFTADQARGHCFVLGVFNPTVYADELLPFADTLPFAYRLWNANLPEAFGDKANTMWLASIGYLRLNIDAIRKVAYMLADPTSLQTFMSILHFRLTGFSGDHPAFDAGSQYLPPDLPGFSNAIVFVDGGAYTGDTGLSLIKAGVRLRSWYAFEPDAVNFAKLVRVAAETGAQASIFPCGLSDRLHQVPFDGGMGLSSRITSQQGDATSLIQCVALDDVVQGQSVDFIKLDVEGAEMAALSGMARTIARNAPRLAVSAYHKPEDLWKIPLKLKELVPTAALYIRQHGGSGLETVAYAIP